MIFCAVFSKYFTALLWAMQVKDSRTVRCQDLEESLAATGGWVPHQSQRSQAGLGLGVCTHNAASLCRTIHMQTQLIWSSTLLQRQGSQESEDPAVRWIEGTDRRETSLHRALTPAVCFPGAPLWPHSEGFLLCSFCLENELCPLLYVHASGAFRCYPVLPYCETLSVSAGSSLQKVNHICVWRVLVMTLGNLCFLPFTLMVGAGRLYWTKKKKFENLCLCLNSSKSAALPCEKLFLIQVQKKPIWVCSDRPFSN